MDNAKVGELIRKANPAVYNKILTKGDVDLAPRTTTVNNNITVTNNIVVNLLPFEPDKGVRITAAMVEKALTASPSLRSYCQLDDLQQTHPRQVPMVIDALVNIIQCAHEDPRQRNMLVNPARQDLINILQADGKWLPTKVADTVRRLFDGITSQMVNLVLTSWAKPFKTECAHRTASNVYSLYQEQDEKINVEGRSGVVNHLLNTQPPAAFAIAPLPPARAAALPPPGWKVRTARPVMTPAAHPAPPPRPDIRALVPEVITAEFKRAADVTYQGCIKVALTVAERTNQIVDIELLSEISGRAWKTSLSETADPELKDKARAVADLMVSEALPGMEAAAIRAPPPATPAMQPSTRPSTPPAMQPSTRPSAPPAMPPSTRPSTRPSTPPPPTPPAQCGKKMGMKRLGYRSQITDADFWKLFGL